ncbi:hypothetical protein [Desulfogranum marinum]|uniref:hypothetical protein n=1 Tax=Desulfogranum marinum TaxID=453220 RepID=UPI00196268BC|nr:hypothetical protein [Desulfogranum marinum]MBM9515255.1 hypothetical protein [Desulfogranum marinum]
MSETIFERLEKQLKLLLDGTIPTHATYDLNAALDLTKIMEVKGFAFQLKDLCPKSLTESLWCANFVKDGEVFSAEYPQAPVAICAAAIGALTNQ